MNTQERLTELYIQLGESTIPVDEKLLEEIWRLEESLYTRVGPELAEPEGEILYCSPYCNGAECWECAAIRGGCPEDV